MYPQVAHLAPAVWPFSAAQLRKWLARAAAGPLPDGKM